MKGYDYSVEDSSDEGESPYLNQQQQYLDPKESYSRSPRSKLKKTSSEPTAEEKEKAPKVWLRSEYLANFGVQYNFTNISIALLFLSDGDVWYNEDKWGGNVSSVLKSIVFAGSIFGMCVMGYVGDVLGRNRAFAVTSMIMVTFSLASAFAPWGSDGDVALMVIAIARFGLGFGIGGCYPLSAAKSAEEGGGESVADKNFDVGLNLFFQGLGNVAPYAAAMCLDPLPSAIWKFRLTLAVGAIPPFIVLLSTWGAEESEEFKNSTRKRRHITGTSFGSGGSGGRKRLESLAKPYSTKPDEVSSWSSFQEHMKLGLQMNNIYYNILATALAWFLYDIAYYGSNAFTPTLTAAVFGSGDDDKKDNIKSIAAEDCLATAVGIPAVLHALWILSRIGTKRLAVWGFVLIAMSCLALALAWTPLDGGKSSSQSGWVLFGLYLFLTFAVNWGPNVSTFVLPQEVYPVEVRATFNGFAAACGKSGAVVGIWIFEKISQDFGIVPLMVIVCALNVTGAIVSQICISDDLWDLQLEQARSTREKTANKISVDKTPFI